MLVIALLFSIAIIIAPTIAYADKNKPSKHYVDVLCDVCIVIKIFIDNVGTNIFLMIFHRYINIVYFIRLSQYVRDRNSSN